MAKAKLNPVFQSLQGTIGNVVLKSYGDKVVLSRKPEFKNRKFTEAQKASQQRFRDATDYAKLLMHDEEKRRPFETQAKETGKPILSLMIADYLREHPGK